jgi:pyruvate, orthophosphate dikinase
VNARTKFMPDRHGDALQPVPLGCQPADSQGAGKHTVAAPGCADSGPAETLPGPERIGFKAHNLARMAALGLPVPAGFVLPTAWSAQPDRLLADHWRPALAAVERATGLVFGDARRPLLLSVRSGAPVSMPGMLDTLLNIGLTDTTLPGLLRLTGNPRLVWDAYRRLLAGFGETVMGVDVAVFDADLAAACQAAGQPEHALDFVALRGLAQRHGHSIERHAGRLFPQDPWAQLAQAMAAVFASWKSERASTWRHLNDIDDATGTAVTVQRMVFGNSGGGSGAGVGFTRHPASGEPAPWMDFLFNAQGEDVVSGRRNAHGHQTLARVAPAAWQALQQACHTLEAAFGDMQDIEFTIENGSLWLLQTRPGKRTPQAAARIALDLAAEGLITTDEARRRTAGLDAERLAVPQVSADDGQAAVVLAEAVCASQGVASGELVLDEARARERVAAGASVLLVRSDADTRDVAALAHAAGLLTQRGARTAHAAVVAREMGKVCLVGCSALAIDLPQRQIRLGDRVLQEGDWLTLDGNEGRVYAGAVRWRSQAPTDLLARLATLRGES